MSKFKIGDKVKVIDDGKSHFMCGGWAEHHGMTNYVSSYVSLPSNGFVGEVVAQGFHLETGREYLIGIRGEDGREFIVEDRGLELAAESSLKAMLTSGRRVKLRNGNMYTVVDGALIRPAATKLKLSWVSINDLGKDLLSVYPKDPAWDVMEVYEKPKLVVEYFEYHVPTEVIWKREEKTAKQLQLEKLQKKAQDVADAIKKLQDAE